MCMYSCSHAQSCQLSAHGATLFISWVRKSPTYASAHALSLSEIQCCEGAVFVFVDFNRYTQTIRPQSTRPFRVFGDSLACVVFDSPICPAPLVDTFFGHVFTSVGFHAVADKIRSAFDIVRANPFEEGDWATFGGLASSLREAPFDALLPDR